MLLGGTVNRGKGVFPAFLKRKTIFQELCAVSRKQHIKYFSLKSSLSFFEIQFTIFLLQDELLILYSIVLILHRKEFYIFNSFSNFRS